MLELVKFVIACAGIQLVSSAGQHAKILPFGFTGRLGPKMLMKYDDDGQLRLTVNDVPVDLAEAKILQETRNVRIFHPVNVEGAPNVIWQPKKKHVKGVKFADDNAFVRRFKTPQQKQGFDSMVKWFNGKLQDLYPVKEDDGSNEEKYYDVRENEGKENDEKDYDVKENERIENDEKDKDEKENEEKDYGVKGNEGKQNEGEENEGKNYDEKENMGKEREDL